MRVTSITDKREKVTLQLEGMHSSKHREAYSGLLESAEISKNNKKGRSVMKTVLLFSVISLLPIVACLAVSKLMPSARDRTTVATLYSTLPALTENLVTTEYAPVTPEPSTLMDADSGFVSTTTSPSTSAPADLVSTYKPDLSKISNITVTNTNLSSVEENEIEPNLNATEEHSLEKQEKLYLSLEKKQNDSASREPMLYNGAYFANDTLLGVSVPCTDAEKLCLQYHRLLFPSDGKCYPLGDGPGKCRFALDRNEFENNSGHMIGTCLPMEACPFRKRTYIKFAHDDQCVKLRRVHLFCGKGPVNLIQHFFGGFECAPVDKIIPEKPKYIYQPNESGKCLFPNLRHDFVSVLDQERLTFHNSCSEKQSVCFAMNQVLCNDKKSCCDLLKQNHCPEGQRVVLNRRAWASKHVTSSCEPMFPCGEHARLMAFDGMCHNKTEILQVLCPRGVLLPNAFGEMSCVTRGYYRHVIELKSTRPGLCEILHKLSRHDEVHKTRLIPECELSGFKSCVDAF